MCVPIIINTYVNKPSLDALRNARTPKVAGRPGQKGNSTLNIFFSTFPNFAQVNAFPSFQNLTHVSNVF